ncbi:hypothetical protein AV530_003865 [Patagioenas fasciata monilis]|uniref:Ras-related protein Rab-39B n=1 Tax=Patagioenas fasciata monilis TaxID=372326 RepID=A0A1V4KZA6_PATFA|nr:hypothetical protein AV530_003865 [Patagioenas fasciata monilis]
MEAIWLYQFRLIVIGDSTVGKSCLIRRFTEGRFAQISDPTVGVDFFSRLVEIEPGKRIKLQIWDTAGQERFRSITRAYYRNSVGGLLLFDITNRRSFQNVHEWLEETKVHVQPYQIVFVLVGHKCDLDTQRQVTRHEAEKLAAAYVLFLLCRAGILSGNSCSSRAQQQRCTCWDGTGSKREEGQGEQSWRRLQPGCRGSGGSLGPGLCVLLSPGRDKRAPKGRLCVLRPPRSVRAQLFTRKLASRERSLFKRQPRNSTEENVLSLNYLECKRDLENQKLPLNFFTALSPAKPVFSVTEREY